VPFCHGSSYYVIYILQKLLENNFFSYRKLVSLDGKKTLDFDSCTQLNISQCATSESSDRFVILIFNPLARPVTHHVRVPVASSTYKVYDNKGAEIQAQLVPLPEPVMRIPGRISPAKQDLVFRAENLPPLGYTAYYIQKLAGYSMLSYAEQGSERFTLKNKVR
jgi:hypothetical protein